MSEYMLPETLVIYRPRFRGRLGVCLMRWTPLGPLYCLFAKRITGIEHEYLAGLISEIDLEPYLNGEE